MSEKYDSAQDTLEHISKVKGYLDLAAGFLQKRGRLHDLSKLEDPEKALFDEYTPRLKAMTYGSDEYKKCLSEIKPALDHHYSNNTHHPEFYTNGVDGMCLFDVVEMLCDWKAASERHADGDIIKSIEINTNRFNLSEQTKNILLNTVKRMGWV